MQQPEELRNKYRFILIFFPGFVLLVIILGYFVLSFNKSNTYSKDDVYINDGKIGSSSNLGYSSETSFDRKNSSSAITQDSSVVSNNERRIVTKSNISVLVNDVKDASTKIVNFTQSIGGFVVNSNLKFFSESQSGYLAVRIPVDRRDDFINFLHGVGIKVVSEQVSNNDITDSYYNIEERIKVLTEQKNKVQDLFNRAEKIEDLQRLQNELFLIQDKIDNLIGQNRLNDAQTKTTLIGINLSTDELSLPYVPDSVWKPKHTFKLAFRSMVKSLAWISERVIWLVVYIPVFALLVLLFKLLKIIYRKIMN